MTADHKAALEDAALYKARHTPHSGIGNLAAAYIEETFKYDCLKESVIGALIMLRHGYSTEAQKSLHAAIGEE